MELEACMYQKQPKPQLKSLAHGLNMGKDQFLLFQEGGEQNLGCTAKITILCIQVLQNVWGSPGNKGKKEGLHTQCTWKEMLGGPSPETCCLPREQAADGPREH